MARVLVYLSHFTVVSEMGHIRQLFIDWGWGPSTFILTHQCSSDLHSKYKSFLIFCQGGPNVLAIYLFPNFTFGDPFVPIDIEKHKVSILFMILLI